MRNEQNTNPVKHSNYHDKHCQDPGTGCRLDGLQQVKYNCPFLCQYLVV